MRSDQHTLPSLLNCARAALAVAVLAAVAPAHASVSVGLGNTNVFYGGTADFRTFDLAAHADTAERTVSGTRILTQTFRLGSAVTLNQLDLLFVRGGSGTGGRLRIFSVANTLASSIATDAAGTSLLDITFTMPAGLDSLDNTGRALEFSFSGLDAITLPATTGTAGYGLSFSVPNGTDNVFTMRFGDPGTGADSTSFYVGGEMYYDAFAPGSTRRDDVFVINPVVVPEPATATLLVVSGVGLAFRFRRRR